MLPKLNQEQTLGVCTIRSLDVTQCNDSLSSHCIEVFGPKVIIHFLHSSAVRGVASACLTYFCCYLLLVTFAKRWAIKTYTLYADLKQ